MADFRKTTQPLPPTLHEPTSSGQYDLYPGYPLQSGQIKIGYDALAQTIAAQPQVIIDGDAAVLWENFRTRLNNALTALGLQVAWRHIDDRLHPEAKIEALIAPFLGGDDPLFGKRFPDHLSDFFDPAQLRSLRPQPAADLNILYGCGAALAGWGGLLIYVDVPKNEIQFRARAGAVHNLGATHAADPKAMYKRSYFIDWPVLNRHKAELLDRLDILIDEQRPHEPCFIAGTDLHTALTDMGRNYFRVRPWFEPGPWGGQWIKEKIPQLPQNVPNYAWSFELITPENGLMLASNGRLLELSFDWLMFHDHQAILGDSAARFGFEFPIRFDFLDTWDGGNLSLQCHPRPAYIRDQFGENFTQDETYYILDSKPGAQVYLGFQAGIDPTTFRAELEQSLREGTAVNVEQHVQTLPTQTHDLFLIPHGTVHCSGKDVVVLEISATPYIFTFKLYDWLRLDLEGKPRPLNIERAFQNLIFERQGERVQQELVSRPRVLEAGEGWQLIHLPTHPDHFYDIHRLEFNGRLTAETNGSPHVLSLVEGESIILETANGRRQRFNYAETFVIPAAAERYELINEGSTPVKVIKAFLKNRDTKDTNFTNTA